jgi:hypothetical protein
MNSHGTSVGYHECGKRKAGYIPVWGWFNNHFPYSLVRLTPMFAGYSILAVASAYLR